VPEVSESQNAPDKAGGIPAQKPGSTLRLLSLALLSLPDRTTVEDARRAEKIA